MRVGPVTTSSRRVRFWSIVTNVLLAPVAALAHLLCVAGGTLDAKYLSGAADRSGVYDRAVPVLPSVLADWAASDLPDVERQRIRGVLARVLTPDLVRA